MSRDTRTLSEDDFYPDSDGRPMAESDFHRDLMVDLIETLDRHFAADPTVYVSGDLLVYFQKGNRRRRVAPDVFLVRGVVKRMRRHYLMWNEGKPPDCVIEVTSVMTRRRDREKVRLYRDLLGVPELFLFDPLSTYLSPSLQGYRLRTGRYEPIEPVEGRFPSDMLKLHVEQDDERLLFFDPQREGLVRNHREYLGLPRDSRADLERLRRDILSFDQKFQKP